MNNGLTPKKNAVMCEQIFAIELEWIRAPRFWDLIGAALCLAGVAVIMYAPRSS